jgi:hypothetical protein
MNNPFSRIVLIALVTSASISLVPAAEPGFQNLFNGRDLSGWEGTAGRAISVFGLSARV